VVAPGRVYLDVPGGDPLSPNHEVPMNIVIVFNAESLVALLVLVRMLQHLF
jgi:hypothetical protein